MCYWGVAWASGPNINAALTPEGGEAAHHAIQRALELADGVTERERAYIEAMALRYEEDPMTERARQDSAYARAASTLADAYPDDPDAQVLAAEALMDLSPWDYWNEDGSPRPDTEALLGRLLPVTEDHLEHAGACHFYIHAVEKFYPERAVPCAERLAGLMPGAGHIVHMPSHIYIRVGRYADAIESNQSAVHAHGMHDEPAPDHGPDEFDQGYGSHNYHFLSFAAQMAGNRVLALETARELESRVDPEMMRAPGLGALQHYLVTPLRVMVRFGMWDEILAEPAPPEDLAYPIGTWRYARGMALARTNRPDEATAELAELRSMLAGDALEGVTVWELNSAHALLVDRRAGADRRNRSGARQCRCGDRGTGRGRRDGDGPHLRRAASLAPSGEARIRCGAPRRRAARRGRGRSTELRSSSSRRTATPSAAWNWRCSRRETRRRLRPCTSGSWTPGARQTWSCRGRGSEVVGPAPSCLNQIFARDLHVSSGPGSATDEAIYPKCNKIGMFPAPATFPGP